MKKFIKNLWISVKVLFGFSISEKSAGKTAKAIAESLDCFLITAMQLRAKESNLEKYKLREELKIKIENKWTEIVLNH